MSSLLKALLLLALAAGALNARAQPGFPGIGRAATPAEVAAWDIDVRPDFQGLPKGSGSVARGQEVWEAKCASCHGVFGESNEVFNPLVGGTSDDDIRTGRVANLRRSDYPGRTTLMKLSSVSTLWDYINRAMPWNQPKSLSVQEVYAVTAYMLNLGGIVPDDFVLSDRTMAQVQQRLPNRNGMTTAHALWPGKEIRGTAKPDVNAAACMKDCAGEPKIASALPDFARNAHGNLAQQNRPVGPQRGIDTGRTQTVAQGAPAAPAAAAAKMPTELLQKNTCTACHASDRKLVGPSWNDVARKHSGKGEYIAAKIRTGGAGVWGSIPMPPQAISAEEAGRIAEWLATGAAP
jgi:S-disulfanyl-L-cysteine oxidoreductase SoxD